MVHNFIEHKDTSYFNATEGGYMGVCKIGPTPTTLKYMNLMRINGAHPAHHRTTDAWRDNHRPIVQACGMHPARHLSSTRLSLTPLQPPDAAFVGHLLGDPQVRAYLGGPVPVEDHPRRFNAYLDAPPSVGIWAMRLGAEDTALGLITLTPYHDRPDMELSYQLAPQCWHQGFGAEAVACVAQHALEDLAQPRVLAETQAANVASCRLLTGLGWQVMARLERFGAQQVLYATAAPSP